MLKLLTDTDIYTLHSDYVVLFHSVRYLLPLNILIKEAVDNMIIDVENL